MKKAIILSALIFSAAGAMAQDPRGGLPGLREDPAAGIQRPDSKRIMSELSPALRLSSKQEERIGGAIAKKSKDFDKLLKEYDKTSAEEKKWHEKVEALKSKMRNINSSLPDVIRGYLDDEQEQNFEAMLESGKKSGAGAQVREGETPGAPKPGKRKKFVKKKKKKPAADQGEAPEGAPEGAATVAGPAEEEPGTTMVDNEKQTAPAKKKKKVKKKKPAAAPAEEPADEPAADEPPAPDGGAPEEDEGGDAGSYP